MNHTPVKEIMVNGSVQATAARMIASADKE